LDKFKNRLSVMGCTLRTLWVSGVWRSAPDSCLLLLYTITTFYKAIVLVIKLLLMSKKTNCASFSIQTLHFC